MISAYECQKVKMFRKTAELISVLLLALYAQVFRVPFRYD